jgi:uncharacterized membrane protein YeaQ/YmgE (transglycosylase-associated protein family)
MIFGDLALQPVHVTVWIIIGMIMGGIVAKMMENPSYGLIGDLLLGAIGAVIGGLVVGFFVDGAPEFWVAGLGALIGALVVIVGGRVVVAGLSA